MEAVYSGLLFKVISHGSIRDATVLAVYRDKVLCEVEYDNYTALRLVRLGWFAEGRYDQVNSKDYRAIIYEAVRYPFLREMVKNNIDWIGNPKTPRYIEPPTEPYFRIQANIDAKFNGFKKRFEVLWRDVARLPLFGMPTQNAAGEIVSWGDRIRYLEVVRRDIASDKIIPLSNDPFFYMVVTNIFRVKDPRRHYGVVFDGMKTSYPQFGKRLKTDYDRAHRLEMTRGDMDVVLVRSDNRLWVDQIFKKQYAYDCHGRLVARGDIICCGEDAYCVRHIEQGRVWGKPLDLAWIGEVEITNPFIYVYFSPPYGSQYRCEVGDVIVVNRHTGKGIAPVAAKVRRKVGKLVLVSVNTEAVQRLIDEGDTYGYIHHWVTANDSRHYQVFTPEVGETILHKKKEHIIKETLDLGGYVYITALEYKGHVTRFRLDDQPYYILKKVKGEK